MLDPDLIRARERLDASRERLLAHMRDDVDPADAPARPAADAGHDRHDRLGLLAALRQRVEANPVGAVLLDTVELWWERHPARAVLRRVRGRLDRTAAPFVRRHPVVAVALATAAGGVLAALRPWQDRRVRRLLQPVQTHLGGWLRAQLSVQTLIHAAVTALATRAMSPSAQDTAEAAQWPTPEKESPRRWLEEAVKPP
ncbi:hypothetical protein ACU6VI_17645 [Sphaerotilus natans]|uniref:hypothetical protein n=1 Tax=Sphaerotilus natans TaxID=34103 RepID=UPI00406BE3A5